MKKKAVFLDRDGTINVDTDYLYRIKDFTYIDGATEALRILGELGYMLIVVTNQSGIARGYYTKADFDRLNQWMIQDLAVKGIRIAKTYFCPHHPMGRVREYTMECGCRKPKTELFWQAQREWKIDMERSFAVGDRLRDLAICHECGIQGILLGSEEAGQAAEKMVRPLWLANDLLQAAERIRGREYKGSGEAAGWYGIGMDEKP